MAGEFLRDKMKILANRDIKQLFCRIAGICLFFWLLTEGIVWHVCHQIRLIGGIAVLFALMFGLIAETLFQQAESTDGRSSGQGAGFS